MSVVESYIKEDSVVSIHYYPEYPEWKEEDVKPIHIPLPSVESFFGVSWDEGIKMIDGYGMKPEDQHFENYRKQGFYEMPPRLVDLHYEIRTKLKKDENESVYPEELFDHIESDPLGYAKEISWIKLQHKRMIQGYWCFIKGKPTYIDPWHYLYLMCVPVGNKHRRDRLPFYRAVDRKIFFFYKWAATTTEAEFNYVMYYRRYGELRAEYGNTRQDLEDRALRMGVPLYAIEPLEEGERLVDLGRRTLFGVVFPKRRRVGGTTQAVAALTANALWWSLGGFAIQALTAETAKDDVYKKKFLPMWRNMWFIFKPSHKSHTETKLFLSPRESRALGKDIVPHGGWVTPRSGENKAFDGNEIRSYLRDEPGKEKNRNVGNDFADTIKNTLAYGGRIHGLSAFVSTLGKMEGGGGQQFFELIQNSLAHERGENGETLSGLATLFIPSFDGSDGKIDVYGDSIINDPPVPFIDIETGMPEREGSVSFLLKKRKNYERRKKWDLYSTELRVNPFTIREAAMPEVKNESWDTSVIRECISDLRFGTPQVRHYKLSFSDGKTMKDRALTSDIKVIMEETDDQVNSWQVSVEPPIEMRSLMTFDAHYGHFKPTIQTMDKFVLGTDAFKSSKNFTTSASGLSKGGGHLFWKRDISIDGDDIPSSEWKSHTTVATYLARPDTPEEFAEEMLKAAILWGSMVNQERNHNIVAEKFIEWGCGGYLIYPIDPVTGQLSKVPGTYTGPATHQIMFELYADYVRNHIKRDKHLRFLEQILATNCFDDITKNDLFAAGGMSFIGAGNRYTQIITHNKPAIKSSLLVQMYD